MIAEALTRHCVDATETAVLFLEQCYFSQSSAADRHRQLVDSSLSLSPLSRLIARHFSLFSFYA